MELVTVLQVEPWSGDAYDRQRADANMRTHAVGKHGEGLVIYLILIGARSSRHGQAAGQAATRGTTITKSSRAQHKHAA